MFDFFHFNTKDLFMTRRFSFKSLLIKTSSYGALDYRLERRVYGFRLPEDYTDERPTTRAANGTLSFLARVKMWLRLLMGVVETVPSLPAYSDAPLNRAMARRRRGKLPLSRRGDDLGYHIYRRYGLKRAQQWLYNRSLTPRVRWCFVRKFIERWAPRENLARCTASSGLGPLCAAPLSPD